MATQQLARADRRVNDNDMARMKGQASPKTAQFVMRLSRADKRMLVELAEERRQTGAEIIRGLLRDEHARAFGERPSK